MLEEAQLAKHVLQAEYDATVEAWAIKFNKEKKDHDALKEAYELALLRAQREEDRLNGIIAQIR